MDRVSNFTDRYVIYFQIFRQCGRSVTRNMLNGTSGFHFDYMLTRILLLNGKENIMVIDIIVTII